MDQYKNVKSFFMIYVLIFMMIGFCKILLTSIWVKYTVLLFGKIFCNGLLMFSSTHKMDFLFTLYYLQLLSVLFLELLVVL